MIDPTTGAVRGVQVPYQHPQGWANGVIKEGVLLQEIPMETDNSYWIHNKVWQNNAWADKPTQPSSRHVWTANGWELQINSEEEWHVIRSRRDSLLADSDFSQIADTPLSDTQRASYRTYRQALRDLPANQSSAATFDDIVWPTGPS